MSGLRIGELCAGYGGLGMGVTAAIGGEVAWVSDIDKGANKVLAHRFPDAPNLGDMTTVRWVPTCGAYEFEGCGQPAEVLPDRSGWQCQRCQKLWPVSLGRVYWPHIPEPVDVICGGTPCQDLSHAGKRAGMTEGTRSNLWVAMRDAIATIKPGLVVWENVGGAYSAGATSELEQREGLLGDRPRRPALRALGRVLGDLASLGYDAGWCGLRAADVGAAHGRLRVFVVAWPAADSASGRPREGWAEPAGFVGRPDVALTGALLPTPAVNDMGAAYTPDTWDAWTDKMKAEHGNGNGHGKSLNIEVQRLLPTPVTKPDIGNGHARNLGAEVQLLQTPSVSDVLGGHERRGGARGGELLLKGQAKEMHGSAWGDYAAAIACAEAVFGPAPAPTEVGPRGNPRLSCHFDEWLMGLPSGWITDVPGITHAETLRLCGNGVVPRQAEVAIRTVLAQREAAAA